MKSPIRIDPITLKRLARFRKIKRGYYSFMALLILTVLSLFSNFIANNRAIAVSYEGQLYFPTFKFLAMEMFDQEDEYGFTDVEADYVALRDRLKEVDVIVSVFPMLFGIGCEHAAGPFSPRKYHGDPAHDPKAPLGFGVRKAPIVLQIVGDDGFAAPDREPSWRRRQVWPGHVSEVSGPADPGED